MSPKNPKDKEALSLPKDPDSMSHKVASRHFLGKKNVSTIDGMPVLFGPHAKQPEPLKVPQPWGAKAPPPAAMNVATLASASLAQRQRPLAAANEGGDALAAYRGGAHWDGKALVHAFGPKLLAADPRRNPAGSWARAWILASVMGEISGLRLLGQSLDKAHGGDVGLRLDDGQRRAALALARLAAGRSLVEAKIVEVLQHLLGALGSVEDPIASLRALLRVAPGAQVLGHSDDGSLTSKQLLDLPRQGLIFLWVAGAETKPTRGARLHKGGKRGAARPCVALLRDVQGQLWMIDPDGLYDASRAVHDAAHFCVMMPKPMEQALADKIAGQRAALPQSPVVNVLLGNYHGHALAEDWTKQRNPTLDALALRYC